MSALALYVVNNLFHIGRYAHEIPDIYMSESKAMKEFAEAEGLKQEAYRAVDELTHHYSSLH